MSKKAHKAQSSEQEKAIRDGVINALKEALRTDAKAHMAAGTVKLPIDPDEFAGRLWSNPLVTTAGISRAEIVKAIEDVCDELGLERLKREQKDDRCTATS
jgi:hypothetical protein